MSIESARKWAAEHPRQRRAYMAAYGKVWKAKNPEKVERCSKKYRSSEAGLKKRRETRQAWKNKNPERYKAMQREWYHQKETIGCWARRLVSCAKASAKRKGWAVDAVNVTREHLLALWEQQDGRCYWLGVPMTYARKSYWKVSLDRIDSKRGYEAANVCLCSWIANRAKGNMPAADFMVTLRAVVAYHGSAPCHEIA